MTLLQNHIKNTLQLPIFASILLMRMQVLKTHLASCYSMGDEYLLFSSRNHINVISRIEKCCHKGKINGYAILKDISTLSGSALQLSTSTLYGALGRMQDRGLIVRVENGSDEAGGPGLPRKAYELTQLGRRLLEAELVRLRRQVQAAQHSLGQEPQP